MSHAPILGPGLSRSVGLRLIADADHYTVLVQQVIPRAKVSVWIATANVKELMVEAPIGSTARARGRYISLLETLQGLADRGVDLRVLHATDPSRAFRAELQRRTSLRRKMQMRQCPRVHLKLVAVDGALLYLGSANFTGAGLGAKGGNRRNFELGVITDDDVLLDEVQGRFDSIWRGRECGACKCRGVCPKPFEQM